MVAKLFDDVAARFNNRSGGYTRTIKTRRRPGDAAEMVAIELIERSAAPPSPQPATPTPSTEGN